MEQVAGYKDHVDVPIFGESHGFVEGLLCVVVADGVSLIVSYVRVGCYEDADGIASCDSQGKIAGE